MHPEALAQSLQDAFASFATATARLEHEYAALRERLAVLTMELEEKNRLLAASLERERKLEAEALRTSRLAAMGEMAAMLAHEVRNPLGAMELFTRLLLDDLHERPESRELALEVARGIADLNHLVTNLLEFTRTQTPRTMPVDCCAVLDDALRYTADLRAMHTVMVERRYAAPTVPACADPDLLRPVVLNLVRNAVQAMPEGGTLYVSTRVSHGADPEFLIADSVHIQIRDTGKGIDEENLPHIFEPFFSTKAEKGTGLGLWVSQGIVQAHGGSIKLRSRRGRGTTFSVALPIGGPAEHGER
jgi:two-component system sensor histidine kinase FlrB